MKIFLFISLMVTTGFGLNFASAANGEVKFMGAVTNTTCDLIPEVGGAVTGLIQLGTASLNGVAPSVDFVLKPDSSQPGCANLATINTTSITWGGAFDEKGVINQGGTATGAWVRLAPLNGRATSPITSLFLTKDFNGTTVKDEGAKFRSTLNGGAVAGDFRSSVSFVVAYK